MTSTTKSAGEYMHIGYDELPTRQDLEEAVKRLRKDADILSVLRGKADTATPDNLRSVANFLESVVTRGSHVLNAKAGGV